MCDSFQSIRRPVMLSSIIFGLLFQLSTLLLTTVAQTDSVFSCDGRVSGYYADVGAGCQVYHMCDGLGRKFSFVCPNATLFQQRMLICDHWFMVNCSKSESEYGANLLIGQKGKPFVSDSGQSSFNRTPRPDYANGDAEKNSAIYQNKVDPSEDSNLVGINSDENGTGSKQYNLPSHWSIENNKVVPTANPKVQSSHRQDSEETLESKQSMRPIPLDRLNNNFRQQPVNQIAQTINEGKHIETINQSSQQKTINEGLNAVPINFESKFKATTPVYPTFVDESLKLNDLDLAPPKTSAGVAGIEEINNLQNPPRPESTTEKYVSVNFESQFKATTPNYPTFVEEALKLNNLELSPPVERSEIDNIVIENKNQYPSLSSQQANNNPVRVNFESSFQATTPVYPTFVEESLKMKDLELNPPLKQVDNNNNKAIKINFVSIFEATTPVYPLSVEATSPIPDEIGLLPPLGETPKQSQKVQETTTRIPINFESNFLATIPNYPHSVEATSPLPDAVGLLPPIRNDPTGRLLNIELKGISQNVETIELSREYEPPLFETGYVNPNGALVGYRSNSEHIVSPKVEDWNELRKSFSVPDYEFPIDSGARRASYESDLSSFQPRPAGSSQKI